MHILKILTLGTPLRVKVLAELVFLAGILTLPGRGAIGLANLRDLDLIDGLGPAGGGHVVPVDALVHLSGGTGGVCLVVVVSEDALAAHPTGSWSAGTDAGSAPAVGGGVGGVDEGLLDGGVFLLRGFDDERSHVDEVVGVLNIRCFLAVIGKHGIVHLVNGLEEHGRRIHHDDERVVGKAVGVKGDQVLESHVAGKVVLHIRVSRHFNLLDCLSE